MTKIPYGRQWISKDDIKEVAKVLKSDWITQGPKIRAFEDAVCRYTTAKYAVAVSNGTAALHIACLAAGIKKGDEAITSPLSFAASANCIAYCSGKPVFADVERTTCNIDPDEVKKKLGRRTRAMIAVHYAGNPCELAKLSRLARKNNLLIIEDAAHALGASCRGSKIGSCAYSDMTIFSFHPVKSVTTGEGGMVLTNNRKLYEKLLLLRNHGITRDTAKMNRCDGPWYYEMQELGFNYRITDFQSALGISQLKKLDKFIRMRRDIVELYQQGLGDIEEIALPKESSGVKSAWHLYVIRLKGRKAMDARNKLFTALRKQGIGVNIHYIPIHLHPFYRKHFGYRRGDFPVAESIYDSILSLPLYPKMTKKELGRVISSVRKFFQG